MSIKWEHRYEQLSHLPEAQLLSLARNESAPLEFRLFAVELMKNKGFLSANHPDLAGLEPHLGKVEIEEIETEEVENHYPRVEIPPFTPDNTHSGAPSASVTTLTMFQEPSVQIMDAEITPANEAPTSNNMLDNEKELTNE